MIIIRHVSSHEVKDISLLWEKMVFELAPDYNPRRDWWEAMAIALLKTEFYHAWVAVEKTTGGIVGFLDGFLYPEPSTGRFHAVGQHFYVLPEFRGSVIAARLYRESLSFAREKGAKVVEFFCFAAEEAFWTKKNYRPVRMMMRRSLCSTP